MKWSLLFHTNAFLCLKNLSCCSSATANAAYVRRKPRDHRWFNWERERMQKPHVQQPAVNSKYVVNLAGHGIFFRVHRQFVSNKKASSFSLSLSGSEETPFSHFVSDYFEAVCCRVHPTTLKLTAKCFLSDRNRYRNQGPWTMCVCICTDI